MDIINKMSSCDGYGECLIQCICECRGEICICGHREHCPSGCCSPVECRNFKYCTAKSIILSQWYVYELCYSNGTTLKQTNVVYV